MSITMLDCQLNKQLYAISTKYRVFHVSCNKESTMSITTLHSQLKWKPETLIEQCITMSNWKGK